ncbi:MAG TPA: PHP domain-containing protein [Microbacteriaceae bacterium]|nr:PHP domain-containing protein [Microbacteriaceae bacterium]
MANESLSTRFDLHTHSTFSDGTTSPEQIAELAKNIGLKGFALTDHDTIDGWVTARYAAKVKGLDFLPGMELTTEEAGRSIHLLAYGTSESDERLLEELFLLRNSRLNRAKEMISRLNEDFPLDWDLVLEPEDGVYIKSVGRPHLADALVNAGYFSTRSEVFEKILTTTSRYYVPTKHLGTIEAINVVRNAGGFPVLAHPAAFRMRKPIDHSLIAELVSSGLGGIELDHPENRPEWIPNLVTTATKHGLLVTGASDFHGAGKPNKLGEGSTAAADVALIRSQVATPN